MTITELIQDLSTVWDREPPASKEAIAQLESGAGVELPEDYLAFLRDSNGGEGELGVQPCWFQIWRAEEVITCGRDYQVGEFAPGFFAFGGNGGGELLAFDTRDNSPWRVVALPCIGLAAKEAMPVTANFRDFVAQMGRTCAD